MAPTSSSLQFPPATRLLAGLVLCAAALFSLSGCVSTTVAVDPLKLPQTSDMKPVVVSVTTNTGEVRGIDQITVQRLTEAQLRGERDQQDNYVLKLVAPGLSRDTSFFVGSLPQGEYRFYSLEDSKTRKILYIPEKGHLLGNFVVNGKNPVDLGRLIITPMNTHVVYGRSVSTSANRSLLERFAPEYARLLSGAVDTGWKAPAANAAPVDAVELYATARPVGASCVTELADGRVVAASRLGTVLVRSTSGNWAALRGPGIESLICVSAPAEPDAELVAMGEFGTLLRKPAGVNKLLPVDTGNLPPGNILRVYGNSRTGWFLALQRGNDVTLYQSASLDAGKWSPIRSESVANSAWSGATEFFMWPTTEGFAYAVSAGPIHFYNLANKVWTERPTPENARLIGVNPSPTGALLALTSPGGGFAGAFASVFISKDQAQSWQPLQVPFNVKAFPPVQAADGTLLMPGGVFSNPELQGSKDEGRTWAHVSKYELGRLVIPLRSGALIDVDNGQWGIFSIRHSNDGGKNWDLEFSNFDRQAYNASQNK